MKRIFALLLCLMFCFAGVAEEAAPERTVAPYEYVLTEEPAYYENLIFNADVVISGEAAQIVFTNCEFNGDIILTSEMATRVLLLGCEVKGACIMNNEVTDADINYNNPKFLTDAPITAVCENGVGSVVAVGDFEITFNGETYSMADADMFSDANNPEAGLVPYEGQESVYCIVAQFYENGEKIMMVVNENEIAE